MATSTTGGALYFEGGIDITKIQEEIGRINAQLKAMADNTQKQGDRMDQSFQQVADSTSKMGETAKIAGGAIATYFSAAALGGFAKEVANVRGEFQQLEISFQTMLKNKAASDELMAQTVQFAAETPYELKDVGDGVKKLLAFNVEAKDTISTLRMLGDISAGLGTDLDGLVQAYGKVKAKGKLQAEEMNLFLERGIPLVHELAKQYNVAEGEVYNMAAAGKVGFSDLENVLKSLTTQGGMFEGMMEKQSKSITGLVSNLSDAWSQMLNNLGKANEGLINNVIEGAKTTIENYATILAILKTAVITYGAYKAAIIAVNVVRKLETAAMAEAATWHGIMSVAEARSVVIKKSLTAAQTQLNTAIKANPYVFAATAIIGLLAALSSFAAKVRTTEQIIQDLDKTTTDYAGNADKIDKLVSKYEALSSKTNRTKTETEELKKIMNDFANVIPGAAKRFDEFGNSLDINIEKIKNYSASQKEALKLDLTKQISDAEKSLEVLDRKIGNLQSIYQSGKKKSLSMTYSMPGATPVLNETFLNASSDEMTRAAHQANELYSEREKLISSLAKAKNTLTGISEKENSTEHEYITASEQRIQLTKQLAEEERKLKDLESKRFDKTAGEDPLKAIEGQKQLVDDLKKKLGINEKQSLKNSEDSYKASEELEKRHLDNLETFANWEAGISAKKISNMADSLEKEKAQNKLAYETRIDAINREREITLKLLNQKAGIKPGSKNEIKDLTGVEAADDAKKRAEANADLLESNLRSEQDWANKIKDIWNEVNDSVLAGYQRELAASEEKYDKMAQQAKGNAELETAIETARIKSRQNINQKYSFDEFQKSINWGDVFGDLDKVSTSALNSLREKLKQFLSTVGDNLSQIDLKAVADAFRDLDNAISARTPISELKKGFKEYKEACDKVREAQEKYNKVLKDTSGPVSELEKAEEDLKKAQDERASSMVKMTNAINNIGKQGSQLVNAGRDVVDMLENVGVNVDEKTKKTLDGLGQTMDGLESIDLTKPFSIVTGGIKTITGMVNTVAALFGGGSHEIAQSVIEEYNRLISTLKDVISIHKELMSELSGAAAAAEGDKAVEIINKQIEATRRLGLEFLASRKAGEHSYGYAIKKAWSEFAPDFAKLGIDFSDSKGGIGQLFTLSPDQLLQIKETLPEAWAKLDDQTRAYLQTIIDSNNELKDTTDLVNERITGTTSSAIADSIVEGLRQGKGAVSDFADNFEQLMSNALVQVLKALSDKRVAQWFEEYAKAWEDGQLTPEEKTKLAESWNSMIQADINDKNNLEQITGISMGNKESANPNTMTGQVQRSITEETGSELVGLWNRTSVDIRSIRDYSKTAIDNLVMVQANTLRTANNTEFLKDMKRSLEDIYHELRTGGRVGVDLMGARHGIRV